MKIISIRENPEFKEMAIEYIHSKWGNKNNFALYEDCITHSIDTACPLPCWYLMEDDGDIIGCAGLITNDFISRMDLYPWLCSLYIEENFRGNELGSKLIEQIKDDAKKAGFQTIYLCTDHVGYYEKYGFAYSCDGYHPWGGSSRIYEAAL